MLFHTLYYTIKKGTQSNFFETTVMFLLVMIIYLPIIYINLKQIKWRQLDVSH